MSADHGVATVNASCYCLTALVWTALPRLTLLVSGQFLFSFSVAAMCGSDDAFLAAIDTGPCLTGLTQNHSWLSTLWPSLSNVDEKSPTNLAIWSSCAEYAVESRSPVHSFGGSESGDHIGREQMLE